MIAHFQSFMNCPVVIDIFTSSCIVGRNNNKFSLSNHVGIISCSQDLFFIFLIISSISLRDIGLKDESGCLYWSFSWCIQWFRFQIVSNSFNFV